MVKTASFHAWALIFTVLSVAASSMIYQFSIVSTLIFLMGDSLVLFSVFTGVFLFAMGIGSFLAAKDRRYAKVDFVRVQFLLAFLGVFALPFIFLVFAGSEFLRRHGIVLPQPLLHLLLWLFGLVIDLGFGIFTGMQLPLLAGIFREMKVERHSLAILLGFDYLGSFVGALAFPLFLLPYLGLLRAIFLAAMVNASMAMLSNRLLGPRRNSSAWAPVALLIAATLCFVGSQRIELVIDRLVYG